MEKRDSIEGCCPHCVSEPTEAEEYDAELQQRRTERVSDEKRKLLNRLSRIEGQIRGIKGMVEKDAYCPDIMIQVSAVNAALNSFNKALMGNHLHGCVTRDLKAGRIDTMDELVEVLQKLMK